MDVSQFLKSFKKNVATKAKGGSHSSAVATAGSAEEAEELEDLIGSNSDDDTHGQPSDYVAGRRAAGGGSERYGTITHHTKSNQEFAALKVFNTNVSRTHAPARLSRQRAAVRPHLSDTRRGPRDEMVAAVRAELLRQREQLQRTEAPSPSAEAASSPVQQVEAVMVQVDDLLQSTETPATNAIGAATLLDFLPPQRLPAESATVSLTPVASLKPAISADGPTSADDSHGVAAPEVQATVPNAQPAKKRSKFERAMALAKADDEDG